MSISALADLLCAVQPSVVGNRRAYIAHSVGSYLSCIDSDGDDPVGDVLDGLITCLQQDFTLTE